MKKLLIVLSCSLCIAGCGDGYIHAPEGGVDAFPRNTVLGPKIHLAPGTTLTATEQVSENSWEYLVKDGECQGNYVVILNRDLPQ